MSFSNEVVAIPHPSDNHKPTYPESNGDISSKIPPSDSISISHESENSSKTQNEQPKTPSAVTDRLSASSTASSRLDSEDTARSSKTKVGGVTALNYVQNLTQATTPSMSGDVTSEKASLKSRSLSLNPSVVNSPTPQYNDVFSEESDGALTPLPDTAVSPLSTDTQISVSSLDEGDGGRPPTARRCASMDIRSPSSFL